MMKDDFYKIGDSFYSPYGIRTLVDCKNKMSIAMLL